MVHLFFRLPFASHQNLPPSKSLLTEADFFDGRNLYLAGFAGLLVGFHIVVEATRATKVNVFTLSTLHQVPVNVVVAFVAKAAAVLIKTKY